MSNDEMKAYAKQRMMEEVMKEDTAKKGMDIFLSSGEAAYSAQETARLTQIRSYHLVAVIIMAIPDYFISLLIPAEIYFWIYLVIDLVVLGTMLLFYSLPQTFKNSTWRWIPFLAALELLELIPGSTGNFFLYLPIEIVLCVILLVAGTRADAMKRVSEFGSIGMKIGEL